MLEMLRTFVRHGRLIAATHVGMFAASVIWVLSYSATRLFIDGQVLAGCAQAALMMFAGLVLLPLSLDAIDAAKNRQVQFVSREGGNSGRPE